MQKQSGNTVVRTRQQRSAPSVGLDHRQTNLKKKRSFCFFLFLDTFIWLRKKKMTEMKQKENYYSVFWQKSVLKILDM